MVRNLEAKIQLEYMDKKLAEAVAEAISPDNFKTPIGLEIRTVIENNRVITEIQCNSKLSTFTATIDDLLFCASTAEKTLEAISKI
jgi:hypothetical protein